MLSMLYVRLTIKGNVGIPESFNVGWYPHKITWSSHLNPMLESNHYNFDYDPNVGYTKTACAPLRVRQVPLDDKKMSSI